MATMKDVADLAGVSRSTVSIVINGLQQERKIPEETCQRVYDAMRELNYQQNIMAKRLRGNSKSRPLIALYWPSGFRNNYMSRYIQGFQAFIHQQHFSCELVIRAFKEGSLCDEIYDILHGNYSAVIFAATSLVDIEFLEQMHPTIPVVLINRKSSVYNTVSADYKSMAERCIQHFAAKDIHEIAILTTDDIHLSSSIRTKALMHYANQYGISVSQKDILISPSAEIECSIPVVSEYLSKGDYPKAIYCDSDYLAMAFTCTCVRMGIRIPQDIEVIAIGILPPDIMEYVNPTITTALLPIEKMAAESFKIIANAISDNSRPLEHHIFQGEFICRESSPA